ncbi:hypothetical protein [Methanospirillum lacunae]|uniref:Uncharacterized protein n=1 Tax=Methanospirillum lacunae TaxID=668570 RepID=A0A2V2NFB6_9EURY|nr:hypothetical protein [Methanospirillum lacunae]PWR74291.1 hypothetical protein DK846_03860 [Methanospirillum lacunae]
MTYNSFFQTPFFLSLTIGVPFCIFKILFGILSIRVGEAGTIWPLVVSGVIIMLWACADLLMNLTRATLDIFGKSQLIEFCTIAQIGRILNAQAIFLAFDTVITFTIICLVLWSGWIVQLNRIESYLWYFATTLNLISLSLVGLYTEITRYQEMNKG